VSELRADVLVTVGVPGAMQAQQNLAEPFRMGDGRMP
jgi:hypothetical protein